MKFTLIANRPSNVQPNQPIPESANLGAWIFENVPGRGPVCVGYTTPYAFAKAITEWMNNGIPSMRNYLTYVPPQQAPQQGVAQPQPQQPPAATYGPRMSAFDAHAFAEQIAQELANDQNQTLWNVLQRFHQQNNVELTAEVRQAVEQNIQLQSQ